MYAIPPAPSPAPVYDPASGMFYQPPSSPTPYLDRPTSPYAYPALPMSPPIGPYVEHGQVWLPPPSMSPIPYNAYTPAPYYGYMASPPTSVFPYLPPPRPSSAEPTPSQPLYNMPPGLPPAVAPPPLLPMPTGGSQPGIREEGKGERASRISHHLRLSSRHRSASPPAHRFHLPDAAPPIPIAFAAAPTTLDAAHDATASPGSSPATRRGGATTLSLSPLLTGGEVVSPRPMLSPKRSFTNDPFDQVTQVENLERIAARAEQQHAGPVVPLSGPALGEDTRDKTLPRPPVPTDKENIPTPRSRAESLFPVDFLDTDAAAAETPPTPTLAAVTSLKAPRGLRPGNDSSGLDALEARLLAEVGTRKPEKGERPPDVRTVMPIAIPRATDVDPPNDSAISSLTLPGLDVDGDERTLRRGNMSARGGSDREDGDELLPTSTTRARASKETMRARDSKETARGRDRGSKETKSASGGTKRERGEKNTSKRSANPEAPPEKDKELHHLRKAAQGRIAAWLGNIDPEVPPPSGTPPPATPPPAALSPPAKPTDRAVSRSPARSPAVSPARSPLPSPKVSPPALPSPDPVAVSQPQTSTDTPPVDQVAPEEAQAAPNPRSSGFIAIGSVRAAPTLHATGARSGQKGAAPWDAYLLPKASPRLAVYPPRSLDPEVKYDVRSARGGRGGIVTSVASLWASATQTPQQEAPKPPVVAVKPQRKPTKLIEQWTATAAPAAPKSEPSKSPAPQADSRPRALRPLAKTAASSPSITPTPPAVDATSASGGGMPARRARMVKSASVPAVVSSSLATPMISSTASLARPAPAPAERHKMNVKLPPTISEDAPRAAPHATASPSTSTSGSTPVVAKSPKVELAFGQARLRELIKRYQGQVNS